MNLRIISYTMYIYLKRYVVLAITAKTRGVGRIIPPGLQGRSKNLLKNAYRDLYFLVALVIESTILVFPKQADPDHR